MFIFYTNNGTLYLLQPLVQLSITYLFCPSPSKNFTSAASPPITNRPEHQLPVLTPQILLDQCRKCLLFNSIKDNRPPGQKKMRVLRNGIV